MALARINKDMMYWARKYAGYVNGYENELPKDIKEKYEAWESGEKFPTWIQLRNVSKKYKVPTAFFFMKNPPKYELIPTLVNYRKLNRDSIYENNSPYLIDNIHSSENRRSIFIELSEDMDEGIPSFERFEGKTSKHNLSSFIREKLDVSLDTQKSWLKKDNRKDKGHYNFLNNWKEVITEKMGVLIFETYDVDIGEMRGLCIYHDVVPIILLNGKDSVNGRIFSLFHELTHLLLGESAICGDDLERDIEVFCNAVSGEFLVPENDLIENLNNMHADDLLKDLSDLYGVSEHVVLRRLLDLNKITKKDYDLKTDYEFIPSSNKTKGNSGNYYRNMIKYNGRPFYSLVLSAYELGIINGSDFSKFTGLKVNQAPKIGEMLYGGQQ